MPDIKISELTAPIAVTNSDILPVVQSSVTRKITWGALKSTLAGALGRSYLGLGTASTANVTTSVFDATAGRLTKVGDFGLPAAVEFGNNLDMNNYLVSGFWSTPLSGLLNIPPGWSQARMQLQVGGGPIYATQMIMDTGSVGDEMRIAVRRQRGAGVFNTWKELWGSTGTNAITVDTGSLGYGTGSGGTVTQATSKSTAVTLNKPSGQITTASDAIAANSAVSFTLTNSKIASKDIPKVVIKSGASAGAYVVQVDAVAAGSCRISIRNMTGGSLSETLVLQFNIEKGATA